jgi:hypothetical protein
VALKKLRLSPWARRGPGTPQANRPAKVGLACSILGLLTVVAYWSGFPIILGASGPILGRAGQGGLARAAYIIGIVAVVLALIAFAADRIGCVLGGPCQASEPTEVATGRKTYRAEVLAIHIGISRVYTGS